MGRGLQKRAIDAWLTGSPLEAGRLAFEALAPQRQPAWAATVLRAALQTWKGQLPVADQVLSIAEEESRWPDGRDAFQAVRHEVISLERKGRIDPVTEATLLLAENAAKVTYNAASSHKQAFDPDSGWWIASCARALVDAVASKDVESMMISALFGHLEQPPKS